LRKICKACQAGKQVDIPHPSKNIVTTTSPLKLIHMVLFGVVAYVSTGGNKYGLVIVDDYSCFTWVFFVYDKSEKVKTFIRRAQREIMLPIKKVRSDNGSEFSAPYTPIKREFLDDEGVKHEFLAPYTPQQNGVVERKNQTLIDMARTMLDEYKTLDNYWAEAINTACHAINRLYLHKYYKKTSYELLTGNKPKVSYLRVFGCKCFILNKKPRSSKFAPKIDEGFLLGYGPNEHAYRVFNYSTRRIEITVDVMLDESNGSQVERVDLDVVGKEELPCEAIKQLAIGDVRPVEATEEDDSQLQAPIPLQGPTAASAPVNS
jgi:transposase InsO family protein